MQHQDCAALEPPVQQAGIAAVLGAAPQGAGAQQRHSLVTASLLPHSPRSCATASLPTLRVQTMLEHLTTRKPAGVCTDLFNHLLIACTLTVLKHLKATNTAFPLSCTPFEGTRLALSQFVVAELTKCWKCNNARVYTSFSPKPNFSILLTRGTCWFKLCKKKWKCCPTKQGNSPPND